ncbi:uncharacterized protein LOC134841548 [Symsagittifera roscoffensis]|uniref:uncharacterized protein LOC134841548 n=1 Tax=Symsagittifera roscoffensis TaxID=84072 RepID=UPI00307CAC3C
MVAKKGKKTGENLNSKIQLVAKSGKYCLGEKATRKQLKFAKAKLVIVANNMTPLVKSEIEFLAMLGKVIVHHYDGNSAALGTAFGKYFRVGVATIVDPGDSDVIKTLSMQ